MEFAGDLIYYFYMDGGKFFILRRLIINLECQAAAVYKRYMIAAILMVGFAWTGGLTNLKEVRSCK